MVPDINQQLRLHLVSIVKGGLEEGATGGVGGLGGVIARGGEGGAGAVPTLQLAAQVPQELWDVAAGTVNSEPAKKLITGE